MIGMPINHGNGPVPTASLGEQYPWWVPMVSSIIVAPVAVLALVALPVCLLAIAKW